MRVQLHHNPASRLAADRHVEEHLQNAALSPCSSCEGARRGPGGHCHTPRSGKVSSPWGSWHAALPSPPRAAPPPPADTPPGTSQVGTARSGTPMRSLCRERVCVFVRSKTVSRLVLRQRHLLHLASFPVGFVLLFESGSEVHAPGRLSGSLGRRNALFDLRPGGSIRRRGQGRDSVAFLMIPKAGVSCSESLRASGYSHRCRLCGCSCLSGSTLRRPAGQPWPRRASVSDSERPGQSARAGHAGLPSGSRDGGAGTCTGGCWGSAPRRPWLRMPGLGGTWP